MSCQILQTIPVPMLILSRFRCLLKYSFQRTESFPYINLWQKHQRQFTSARTAGDRNENGRANAQTAANITLSLKKNFARRCKPSAAAENREASVFRSFAIQNQFLMPKSNRRTTPEILPA